MLRYSDLLKELEAEDREAFALMKKQKLQLLAEAKGDEKLIDAIDYDMEARILPQHLMWPSFFVAKQGDAKNKHVQGDAKNKHVLLRRIQPPVKNLEDEAIEALSDHVNMLWTGAAGIGKSTYGNEVAEKLVRNFLGESDDKD